ncbi:MAG: GBS Bsp-like repeat-containing protein, partial [Coriobacteriia bacterium]|nr:GBS Bsp-like repeat-containing protein [Coriobacteriia bacterium]
TPNQSNLVWYNATRQANGTYRATVNVANHGFATGTYQVHVYATAANGVAGNLATTTATTNIPAVSVTATVTSNQMNASIRVSGGYLPSASSVVVPVWRSANQSDLIWYPAQRQADGSWIATVTTSNHKLTGTYTAHVYATISGVQNHVGGTTFTIASPTATVAVRNINEVAGTFEVVTSNINSPSGVVAVQVPVWSNTNQSDIIWHNARNMGNGTWVATINIRDHVYSTTTARSYLAHVYLTPGHGARTHVGSTLASVQFKGSDSAIMGSSQTTVAQMVNYFNSTGRPYPAAVYTQYGAPNITAWCQILLEEANREGVRAEVVFCQAMKETGWLQFGGQVSVGQCNFGGLGATNGGAAGADFSGYGADGVRIGLRAQVQHLKGYATTIPASQFASPIVSPRFHLLEQLGYRGIAPTLEGLNGRWAVPGTTYGQDILAMINFLFAYPR